MGHEPSAQYKLNNHFSTASDEENTAIVVCDDNSRRSPIIACNESAIRQELCAGMPLGVAMSICHSLHVLPRDRDAENDFLRLLATEAKKLSSQVSIDNETLIIEIAGSLKLHGDLTALIEHTEIRIGSMVSQYQAACATTPSAASLLSRYANGLYITDHSRLVSTISRLPLSALSLQQKIHQRLSGMGIENIGDLLRLPRDGVARRAGVELIQKLDQITGKATDLFQSFEETQSYSQLTDIDYDLDNLQSILNVAQSMLDGLSKALKRADTSVSSIEWTFLHPKEKPTIVQIKLSEPVRDSDYLFELSLNRLENTELPETVTSISLSTSAYNSNQPESLSLFPETLESRPDTGLIDRLRARLGNDAVKNLAIIEEHRPEFASEYVSADSAVSEAFNTPKDTALLIGNPAAPLRPLWLLTEPRKLQTNNSQPVLDGVLRISSNQERIESGWWETHSIRRDYYIAIDVTELRLWIYRDLHSPDDWYLHGIFG